MDMQNEARTLLLEAASELSLLKYQLGIAQTIIGFLSVRLVAEKINMTEIDQKIMESYNKVMNSRSYEQAEAHFMSLADELSQKLGFTDFDSLKKNIGSFPGEMYNNNEGEF